MQAKHSIGPGIVMIIVSLIFLSQAIIMEKAPLFDPASGSFLPALISVIMLIAGITVVLPKRKKAIEDSEASGQNKDEIFSIKDYRFIIIFFLMIVVYVILLSIITFFPATFIFLCASMFYFKDVSWKVNVSVSVGSIVVIYFLFSQLFKIIFP